MGNAKVKEFQDDIIQIDELREFVVPLTVEEFDQLKENLLNDGCRDPLTIWKKSSGESVLLDGHNRYKICKEYNIPFTVVNLAFENIDKAKFWMINNQLGRRNLNPDQMSYYRGLKYENLKKNRGGYEFVESVGQNELPTYTKLAEEFNVSESTIKRDAKYARGLAIIGQYNPELKNQILTGETKIRKSDIILFSDVSPKQFRKIKNEADLHNKANSLRNKILTDIEKKLKDEKQEKVRAAQEELESRDSLFINDEERVNRVKAGIMSAINRAIQKKDVKAINELRGLIDKLEVLLFGD